MANQKITDLPAIASFSGDELFEIVNDPAGTPVSNQGTLTQILTYIQSALNYPVDSVNGQTDVVVLDTGDISESGNLYFTDERAQDAVGGIIGNTSSIDLTYNDGVPSIVAAISATYVGQASITTLGTITTGVWNGTDIAVTDGGTGASTAAGARTNLGVAIGSNVQAWDAMLDSLAAYNTNGFLVQSAADTLVGRSIAGTASQIDVTNGNGVSGNPTISISTSYVGQASITTLGTITTGVWDGTDIAVTAGGTGASTASSARTNLGLAIGSDVQAFDATLSALAAYNTNGLLTQTATDTFTGRTLIGTTNQIDVTNGNGVSGNPTISISASYVGQASITTLGTITTGVWTGTTIAVANGGTGTTSFTADRILKGNGASAIAASGLSIDSNNYLSGYSQAAAAVQALTDGATIDWNMNSGAVATVTLGGNRTLNAPTNIKAGATYALQVTQDGTGNRTLAWNSVFKFPGGTDFVLSTAASAVDVITFVSFDGTNLMAVGQQAFS